MRSWQCDDCGTRYRVAWLSHCPRCEALPPARKRAAAERGKQMPKANKAGGASSAWERAVDAVEHEAEKMVEVLRGDDGPEAARPAVAGEGGTEFLKFPEPGTAAPAVAPGPAPVAAAVAPKAAAAPVAPQDAPAAPTKGSAA